MQTRTLTLYELGGPPIRGGPPRHYSVFSWRTRLALAHKGLAFESVAVKVTDKAAIAFSGQTRVPILRDGDAVVFDSFRIAEHLEDAYPGQPTLFGGDTGRALARLFNAWADRQLIPVLLPGLMLQNTRRLDSDDAAHLRAQLQRATGRTLEELDAARPEALAAFLRLLDPVRVALRAGPYLSGAAPRYADHVLFSLFQWARVTTAAPLVPAEDALSAWFDRLLDAYAGLGRSEPAAAEAP